MRTWIVHSVLMLAFLVMGFSQSRAQQEQALSPQQIDSLTAPVALYPDALLAQLMVASTNFSQVESFAGWLGKNSKLTGSALQGAAQKAGYEGCYVALAPFPEVVKMMVQKPEWTKQLGQAFTANKSAVFDSIQRLRAEAQAKGNLNTNEQQEVVTQTSSSGQQVIVIQPANPQVIYVPQYNPQVVYVQSAPPPSSSTDATGAALVGFTAGIIIGAAASDNYYYGPYGWRGGAMYNEAWEDRYEYAKDLQENRYEYAKDVQENRQEYAKDVQENRQEHSSERRETYQENAPERQAAAQSNREQRQATQQTSQGDRATRLSEVNTSSLGSGQVSSQRSGMSSGGFSGYQNGSTTRSQSSRGSRSLGSSRRGRR